MQRKCLSVGIVSLIARACATTLCCSPTLAQSGPCPSNPYCGCTACGCGGGCACGIDLESPPSAIESTIPYSKLHVEIKSRIAIQDFGSEYWRGNDCWGYVSATGYEYALMGLDGAVAIVRISDPSNPVTHAIIPHSSSIWGDIKVFGHYAYVSNEAGGGVQVLDLSEVDGGRVEVVTNVTEDGLETVHNLAINPAQPCLYTCGANLGRGGLIALSLANPRNPTIAGMWDEAYVHDAQIVTMAAGPLQGREVAFCCVGRDGLAILDVTDKADIRTLSWISYPGQAYTHQGWLSADQRYWYVNDELDEVSGLVSLTTSRVFDVSNLAGPTLVRTFTSGRPASDHNLYYWDGFIYEANYRSGMRVFNASDPAKPQQVGYFDTHPESDFSGFAGAWSVYAAFPSKTVIVSDVNRGLFVLDATAARNVRINVPPPPPEQPNGPPRREGSMFRLPPFETVFTSPEGEPGLPVPLPLAGDLDSDGDVDASDLVMLLEDFGKPDRVWSDLNGDRLVNAVDLAILLASYGGRS